jgi:hypothetical protein
VREENKSKTSSFKRWHVQRKRELEREERRGDRGRYMTGGERRRGGREVGSRERKRKEAGGEEGEGEGEEGLPCSFDLGSLDITFPGRKLANTCSTKNSKFGKEYSESLF